MKKVCMILFILVSVFSFSNYFFGNVHSHTSYSDGTGDPFIAFEYAKNNSNLDILCITDHGRSINLTSRKESEWDNTEDAGILNSDETFLGIRGFEWTLTGPGHITIYDTKNFTSSMETSFDGIYKWIILNNGIGNFCHPKPKWGTFNNFQYYPLADKYMTMFEIINSSDSIQPIYFENYIAALNKGWHIAPTANQDNHEHNWGTKNRARTVFIMDDLTEKDLYDSMRKRHLFASEDENVKVNFYCEDHMMGEILYDLENADFIVEYDDPGETVDKFYLYSSNGYEIFYPDSDSFSFTINKKIEKNYEWFFVKFVQRDSDDIVTAPIWIQNSKKTYLLSPCLKTEDPVKGKEYLVEVNLVNMNFQNEKFIVEVKNSENESLFSKDIYVDPISNYVLSVPLSDQTGNLKFFLNGSFEKSLDFDFKSASIKVDISHENNFNKLNNIIQNYSGNIQANFEKLRALNEQSLLNTDLLIIPLPDSESFMPKYGIINNEEIDLLNDLLKDGKLIVLMIYDNKNGTLPSVVDAYNKLLITHSSEFLIDFSGKHLIKNDDGDSESSVKMIAVDSFSEKQITDEIGIILGE
jgi:hypothetical protein